MEVENWFKTWFDSPYYHLLYHHRDEEEAKSFVDVIVRQLSLAPPANILDLACGRGRHARYLATKGFRVWGIDLAPSNILFAQKYQSPNLTFLKWDMRKEPFPLPPQDVILNLFTSFGYFYGNDDNIRILNNIANSLSDEGVFVLDFLNSFRAKSINIQSEYKIVNRIFIKCTKRILGDYVLKEITVDDKGKVFDFVEMVQLIDYEHFIELFRQANLKVFKVFGDYKGGEFDYHQSDRIIFFCKKCIN